MNPTRHSVLWATGALLGLALAVALTWTASRLAGEHIGLASAPPSVVSTLAMRSRPAGTAAPPASIPAPPASTAAPPAPPATAPTTAAPAPSGGPSAATASRPRTARRDDAGDRAGSRGQQSGPDD